MLATRRSAERRLWVNQRQKMMSAMTAAFLGSGRRLRVAVAPLAIVNRV
jgi:hypothetical protein